MEEIDRKLKALPGELDTLQRQAIRVGMLAPMLRARGVGQIIHILPNGESIEFDESVVPSIW